MATGTKDAPAWSRVEGTLMATARVVRKAYDAALAPIKINLAEASVLAYLATSDGLTQVQIAARMGASRARVGAYIDALEARNAVVRERDPDDRRVWKVRLTPEGKDLWLEAVQVDRAVRRALRSGLSTAELDALDSMLTRVRDNLDTFSNGATRRVVTDGARRPLDGLRVVEAATLAAGPLVGTALGEFGAEVVKVEQPGSGDPMRTWGDRRDGIGLVWKSVARNKRCVTLDLRHPEGQALMHDLLAASDVLIVGNRPSALTRWTIDYESVHARHPRVVMLHVSGYGRGGPKSDRPGYGTLAEAMSGFAHVTGQPDQPPTLPPFMLADGVASLAATYAVMMALYHRDAHGGEGQLVDVNLIEPLARLIESSTLAFDQLGIVPGRVGNHLAASAPRNAYRTADDRWLALSSASPSIAVRLFRAIGRPELAEDPDYVDPVRRQERAPEVDELVEKWVRERTLDDAMFVFEAAEVTAAPVYDAPQLLADEHLRARGTFVAVDDPDFGRMTVHAPVAQLTDTPGRVEHLGRALGADNDAVYGGLLGLDAARLEQLRSEGVI